jgi:hypothetical protein
MRLSSLALVSILTLGSPSLFAGSIPYPSVRQLAPANTLTASATGAIVGYFAGSDADTLVFNLPNDSAGEREDSINHNGLNQGEIAGLPPSLFGETFVGLEDLAVTGLNPLSGSNLDYNDGTSTFALLGTGLIAVAGVLRHKFAH